MKKRIDISIIIVNYNVKDYLFQCLKSIKPASSNLDVEVIVVDNNSKDGSVEYLKPLFPDVNFIALNENIGFGRANNKGIERANGRYLLILNPDTILEESTLDVMYEYMENDPKAGVAGCKVLNADGSFQLQCRRGYPTPWASFSKLFGLQKLFPKSKLFAKYNMTYLSENETYYIDAVIGAFMFIRRDAIEKTGGFDPDFFMYGEDIDLCYRINQAGWKTAYVHTTSIIHFKGESTRRSSIDQLHHFYEAMKIFVTKHHGQSIVFLSFLRLGIKFRSIIAYLSKYRLDIIFVLFDILAFCFSILLATKVRSGSFFGLPDYAYPTVYFVAGGITSLSIFVLGEYFERRQSIRRVTFGILISFFILSTLTYFFKEKYAFSRGVLLMTIGFSIIFSSLARFILQLFERSGGKNKIRHLIIVGINEKAQKIANHLKLHENAKLIFSGFVNISKITEKTKAAPVLGNIDYLPNIISKHATTDVIIADSNLSKHELMTLLARTRNMYVNYHIAEEYEEFLVSNIIQNITSEDSGVKKYNLGTLRYRLIKRFADIGLAFFLLTIGLPFVYLSSDNVKKRIRDFVKVLSGKMSITGYYPIGDITYPFGKPGMTGLVHISKNEDMSEETIKKLNLFYIQNYSVSLDIDIILKTIFRKNRGK